jgi:hypothetical protein
METKMVLTKRNGMVQWIPIVLALLGFVYNGYKDYSTGQLQPLTKQEPVVKTNYPIQYCLMAYDPNSDKVYYQHENGTWYDYAPRQRRYEATPQRGQGQESYALGNASGASGTQVYGVR